MCCNTRWATTICVIVVLATGSLHAATVYVSTTGDDASTGQTWPTAKRTVQAGLDAAVDGDEVWVVEGTYVENVQPEGGGEPDRRFWRYGDAGLAA